MKLVLQGWLRRQKTPVGLAKRARAMLLLAEGQTYSQLNSGLPSCNANAYGLLILLTKKLLAERLEAFIGEWNALAKRGVSPSLIRLIGAVTQWQKSWASANPPNLIWRALPDLRTPILARCT